jgi:hypothetical protein
MKVSITKLISYIRNINTLKFNYSLFNSITQRSNYSEDLGISLASRISLPLAQ